MTTANPVGIPLIVGVTGHRDLVGEDLQTIRNAVAAKLQWIESETKGVQRILLSGLAEGADQLVAQEAIKRSWDVIAVLPMPWSDFVQDFTSESSLQCALEIRAQCCAVIELPWLQPQEAGSVALRSQQYRNQGVFLARHAQLVLALWDGLASPLPEPCGTSYVVSLCREGLPPIAGEVLASPETTSLIHILVKRQSGARGQPVAPATLPVDSDLLPVCREFRAYNCAVEKLLQLQPHRVDESCSRLISASAQKDLDPATGVLLKHFAYSDVLASVRQQRYIQVVRVASLATILGGFAQATNTVFGQTIWVLTYTLLAALAYGLYMLFIRLPLFRIENRYLEYRALAEALRVQIFWQIAGLTSANVAEHYLQLIKTEVGWVREALHSMSIQVRLADNGAPAPQELVETYWLDSQIAYFVGTDPKTVRGKAHQCKRLRRRFDYAVNAAISMGACLLFVSVAASLMALPTQWKAAASAYSVSFFLMGGVIKGYIAAMGYAEQGRSFEKMGAVFRNAQRVIEAGLSDRMDCLFALGKHALAENADWLIQRRNNAYRVRK
jgi:hypothetical protein